MRKSGKEFMLFSQWNISRRIKQDMSYEFCVSLRRGNLSDQQTEGTERK